MATKESALDTLAREELGIDPGELGGSPWSAAAASFSLFSLGAIFPVAPFFWLDGLAAVGVSVVLSGLALMAIGAGTSLFTGRSFAFSAARQLCGGLGAAAITYGVGRLIGVTVTG
jgi:VIT1/CCC1 family predicted Fe2+/Mn2+ transporter